MAWSIRDSIEKRDPNIRELRYVDRRALVEAWMDDKLVPVDELKARYEDMRQNEAEAEWERRTQPDDTAYRRSMKEAGRGHLLKD